jgi:diguanylate cyclase (GGDEF)-like protein
MPIEFAGQQFQITVSSGSATYRSGLIELDMILQQADKALYQAKESGKNKLVSV